MRHLLSDCSNFKCTCVTYVTYSDIISNEVHYRLVYVYSMYVYILYMCDPQKSLNDTLAVDLPFQTLAVDFSLNL